ncbi:MAG: bifunctional DNA-formamidopyrimidine glycosylase/DNA-(apurinic or apyrimidinic site) lyase, partial [bacterium]
HYDLVTDRGRVVRYRDPRRFGCLLWTAGDPMQHDRIRALGAEPLEAAFDGRHLRAAAARRTAAVKTLLMNAHVVVGVGNIYAAEALFDAGIHPLRGCHRISAARYQRLADSVRKILTRAIAHGGSTIRDFAGATGAPGYFEQELMVYGRDGQPCRICRTPIRNTIIAQRSTFYCARCQR